MIKIEEILLRSGISVIFVILLGCATKYKENDAEYSPVPEIRLSFDHNKYSTTNLAIVIFKRDFGMMGYALDAMIGVDGEYIANIRAGESLKIGIVPGEHLFAVKSGGGVNFGTPFIRTLPISLETGRVYTLRIFPMPTQGILIERAFESKK